MELWEILIPTIRADGRPYRTRYHRVWDERVRAITGGLTIMPVAKGQWVSPKGQLFAERMIPVRVALEEPNLIHDIIKMTLDYYADQEAIMAYKISDDAIIARRPAVWSMKMHFTNDWLRDKIETDPDVETEAGMSP